MMARQIMPSGPEEPLARLFGWILLLWAVANFGPHLLVWLIFGEPYFGLPLYLAAPIEVSLMALNLGLPLWWLRRRGIHWRTGLAWHWEGRRTWLWGLSGLALMLVLAWGIGAVVPTAVTTADQGRAYTFPEVLLVLAALLILWTAALAGEEAMFRGWMQTRLETRTPVWLSIVLPALLFGLRHLPLDLYEGHAGVAGWAARLLELYGLALVMSLIRWRTGSVSPTIVLHGGLWWLVVLGVYGTWAGAVAGIIIGTGTIAAALTVSRD